MAKEQLLERARNLTKLVQAAETYLKNGSVSADDLLDLPRDLELVDESLTLLESAHDWVRPMLEAAAEMQHLDQLEKIANKINVPTQSIHEESEAAYLRAQEHRPKDTIRDGRYIQIGNELEEILTTWIALAELLAQLLVERSSELA